MIVELRRYVITPGERDNFAQHFESYFPEAFQQLAARVALAAAAERAQALVLLTAGRAAVEVRPHAGHGCTDVTGDSP